MNQVYRHIWSKALGRLVVVPECAKSSGRRTAGSRRHRRVVVVLAAAAGFTVQATPGLGDTSWTNGSADSNWNNPANWSNGLPVNNPGPPALIGDVSSEPAVVDVPATVGSGRTWVGSPTGDGTLIVRDGGTLAAGVFELLGTNGFAGFGVVTGPGSTITASGNFIGAYEGTGHLLIENGGSLTASSGHLGQYNGSLGTLTVTGTGSLYDVNYLDIGGTGGSYSATGILTIANNGVVDVDSTINVAESVGTTGIVNIGAAEGDTAEAAGNLNAYGYELRLGAGSASLVFNHTDNAYSFATPITGTGQLRQLAGTTILSGANTWSGLTVVEGGELRAGGVGALSAGNTFVVNGGTLNLNGFDHSIAGLSGTGGTVALGSAQLAVNQAGNGTFAGDISGTGSFEKLGAGTTTLTGTATHSGGTTISAGTLQIGDGGTSGSIGGDITNNAALIFHRSDALTFAGDIAGSGSLQKLGAGTTTLTGTNTFNGGTTISGGTLQIGDGGTSGSIVGNINNNAALAFNRSDDVTFAGDISGTGSLEKLGVGTLTLTGASTYSGGTTISAGTLSIGAADAINNGAGSGMLTLDGGRLLTTGTFTLTKGTDVATGATGTFAAAGGTTLTLATGAAQFSLQAGSTLRFGSVGDGGGTIVLDLGTALATPADGQVFIDAGTVRLGSGVARAVFGGNGAPVHINSGATFDINGQNNVRVDHLRDGAAGGGLITNGGGTNRSVELNNGALDTAFSGVIQDGATNTLGIVKQGAGALTLSGANTYSGGTTISAGTLNIGDGGTSGSIAGDVTNNATLAFNRSDALTFAGDISGTGSFEKLGGGTTTLTGAVSHSGGTTISAGTLQVGDGGTSGSIAGDITNNAALAFNRSDALTFAGDISGTGSFEKLGGGTTTLTGAVSHSGGTTISAGRLQVGDGGTSGSIVGDITNNAALAFNRSDDVTFAGDISGTGSLQKLGGGTTTLSGLNTYTGTTTVDAGILEVAAGGSIATSAATVNAGGLVVNGTAGAVNVLGGFLGGAGAVGATVIGNGGTLSPGNSIGTITVNGQLTFAPGSTYQVEVSPTNADRTNVTGTANLSGATVVATYEPGSYVAKQYIIVNATGGVSGEFDGLNGTAPAGFKHSLSYDANNAYLNLVLLMSTGVGQFSNLNQNQKGVADALSSYFDRTGGIPGAFAALTKDGLTANSGEEGAAAQGAGMAFGSTFIDTIGGPELGGAGTGGGDEGGASAYAAERPSPAAERFARLSYAAEELSGSIDAGTRAMRLQHRLETGYGDGARKPERLSVWGAALGGGISLAGNPVIGSQAVSGSTVGLASGFDWTNGATRAGLALGASWSSSSVAGLGTANLGNVSVGLRASHDFGRLYLSGAFAYGVHFATTTRAFAGETYTATFTGQSISARAEAGWRFRTKPVDIIPFVAGRVVSFSTPAYTETGSGAGTFALAYGAAASIEARSELGMRLHKAIDRADGSRTTFSGALGWAHYFSRGRTVTAGFVNLPGTQFVTQGATGASNTALVSLGVSHRFANGLGISLDADGEFGAGTIGYAAKGKVSWKW